MGAAAMNGCIHACWAHPADVTYTERLAMQDGSHTTANKIRSYYYPRRA